MRGDNYRGAADGWGRGATLVYAPIAAALVGRAPIPLRGARVLDVGAGTGVCEAPLRAAGATRIVGVDLSYDMLAWERTGRPPAIVSDVMRLPFAARTFDAAIASFVLNHLEDPIAGLRELARVLAPGGALLATVYANSSQSANRDAVDAEARAHGWVPPAWYQELKTSAVPLLGTEALMRAAAVTAGLVAVTVAEEAVDVNVREPGALVAYRFGQAHFSEWMQRLGADERAAARADAVEAIADTMQPYCPRVVFLTGRTA